jgi:hypothetical protein
MCRRGHRFPEWFRQIRVGLRRNGSVESYKGLVFGTWDPTAPPLAGHLADAALN